MHFNHLLEILLAAVPTAQAQACLESLRQQGYAEAAIIGEVRPLDNAQAPLSLWVA